MTDHRAWREIDYQPAVKDHFPNALLEHIGPGTRALDVGCGTGRVACFLAERGISCFGIDLNAAAIDRAKVLAEQIGRATELDFRVGDFCEEPLLGHFDAVLMTRFLTCLPDLLAWRRAVSRVPEHLRPGGIWYLCDFLIQPSSSVYSARYQAGLRETGRQGNFSAASPSDGVRVIAHHHTPEDLQEIRAGFSELRFSEFPSLSMNGNPVRMFEFIGRRA